MKKLSVYLFGYGVFLPLYLLVAGLHVGAGFIVEAMSDFDKEFLAKHK